MKTISALLAIAMLATPAMADAHYRCEGSGKMTVIQETREIRIERPGEITISLPWAGASSTVSSWGIGPGAFGCTAAPCAVERFYSLTDVDVHYELDAGHKVPCTIID